MSNSTLKPASNEDIYKREFFKVIMPMAENSNIFDTSKFDIIVHAPDDDGVRLVLIEYKTYKEKIKNLPQ